MALSEKGVYISKVGDHLIKVVSRGSNTCAIYLDEVYQGMAPADYVERKITLHRGIKQASDAYCKNSENNGGIPGINVFV